MPVQSTFSFILFHKFLFSPILSKIWVRGQPIKSSVFAIRSFLHSERIGVFYCHTHEVHDMMRFILKVSSVYLAISKCFHFFLCIFPSVQASLPLSSVLQTYNFESSFLIPSVFSSRSKLFLFVPVSFCYHLWSVHLL